MAYGTYPDILATIFFYNLHVQLESVEWLTEIKPFLLQVNNKYTDEMLLYCKLEKEDVDTVLIDRMIARLQDNQEDFLNYLLHMSELMGNAYFF